MKPILKSSVCKNGVGVGRHCQFAPCGMATNHITNSESSSQEEQLWVRFMFQARGFYKSKSVHVKVRSQSPFWMDRYKGIWSLLYFRTCLLLKITGDIQVCKPLNIPPAHFLPSAGVVWAPRLSYTAFLLLSNSSFTCLYFKSAGITGIYQQARPPSLHVNVTVYMKA